MARDLASYIDHTILKPDATEAQVRQICDEARSYSFAAVCIPPCYVQVAADHLKGTNVQVATVVGFPLGYNHPKVKFLETHQAIANGATEIDVVINISAMKSGRYSEVQNELSELAKFCHLKDAVLKVIIETALLTEDEIVKACELCANAGVDYVKTSTGFAAGGAKVAHIELMRRVLPAHIKIKASGGIKTLEDAQALVNAGSDRLGCSASIQIVTHEQNS